MGRGNSVKFLSAGSAAPSASFLKSVGGKRGVRVEGVVSTERMTTMARTPEIQKLIRNAGPI